MRMQSLIIIGQKRICEHYGIGEKRLKKMVESGMPYTETGKAMTINIRQVADWVSKRAENTGKK